MATDSTKTRDLVTQVRQNRLNKVGLDLDAFVVEYNFAQPCKFLGNNMWLKNYNMLGKAAKTTSLQLARKAKYYNINLTIDAEEADRLELSLVVLTKLTRNIPT